MGAVVNHLFTDLRVQRHTPVEVLDGDIASSEVKAFFCKTLEKTCYVALLVLLASVFAVSYNLVVLTGVMPLAMAGLILLSPALVIAPIKLAQMAHHYTLLARADTKVKEKLITLENWQPRDVEQFFNENQMNLQQALPTLRQIDENNPHSLLLPLIARFKALQEEALLIFREQIEAPERREQQWREKEAREGITIPEDVKQKNRYEGECKISDMVETVALPNILNAVTLQVIMQNPRMTDMDVVPLSTEIPGVGKCLPRIYPERMFGKIRGNDDYFSFHPDLHRPTLSHQAILNALGNIAQLRALLYPGN